MQHNNTNPMKRFWKENGYYILLGLCVVAVGVSGYFFVTGAMGEQEEAQAVLSIPATVEEPVKQPDKTPAVQAKPETAQKPANSAPAAAQAPEKVLPVSGAVIQDHAMDRLVYQETTQDWRVHNGVDLAAPEGQSVKAARGGQVTAVYEDEYYGTTVVIAHDGGYTSHYCNLAEATAVAAGDQVAAGDTVGTIGATALMETAQESHLHFEVYHNGQPVDPAGFLY